MLLLYRATIGSSSMFETSTLRTPPEVSLPMVKPAEPTVTSELRITMFSLGRFTRNPSPSRPDLMTSASSLAWMSARSTRTFLEESMSTPSVLGMRPVSFIRFRIFTPSTWAPSV